MAAQVFISHSEEDTQRLAPLLRALDSWGVSYYFDTLEQRAAGQGLSQQAQAALVEAPVLLRVCTRYTARSYWMSIESGAFLSLQADDHRAGALDRRKMVNLILDSAYMPAPFDTTVTGVDASNPRWPGWVNDLRRTLGLPPLQDIARLAHDINPPKETGLSRRQVIGLGAAGAVVVAGAVGGLALARRVGAAGAKPSGPQAPISDKRLRWWFLAGDASAPNSSRTVSGAPTVDGATIYVGTQGGALYALTLDGKQLWVSQPSASGQAIYQSPAVAGGVAFICRHGADNSIQAIQNGARLWGVKSITYSYSVPTVANNHLYVNGVDLDIIDVYDLTSGAFLYGVGPSVGGVPVCGPAVVGKTLYMATDDGYLYALGALQENTTPYWRADVGAKRRFQENKPGAYYVFSTPAVVGDTLYAGSTDFNVYALDTATGAERWHYLTGGPILHATVRVEGGVVYAASEDSALYALDARDGHLIWRYQTKGRIEATPLVDGNTVYLASTDTHVYALDAATGAMKTSYALVDQIFAGPVLAGDTLVVADAYGYVYGLSRS